MIPRLLASAVPLAFLAACGATPAPVDPSLPSTSASATITPPLPLPLPSPSPISASPSASAVTPPEQPPGPPDPAPLNEEEQKEVERRCKPLTAQIQKAKGTGKTPLEALTEALKKPSAQLKKDDLARCSELLDRGIRTYLIAAREVEATVMMKQIGRAIVASFDATDGKLCPSSEHPVPRDKAALEKAPYVSTDADWDTPSWKCLGLQLTGLAQRFQYEVSVDPTAKTFTIIARGLPGDNGRWVTLRQRGRVGPKQIEIDPIERR